MTRRYMLVKIICNKKLTGDQFHEALDHSARRYFGEIGLARIDPRVVSFDSDSSTAIVSCERSAAPEFQSAMALISEDGEDRMSLLTLRTSGTIKGAARGKK